MFDYISLVSRRQRGWKFFLIAKVIQNIAVNSIAATICYFKRFLNKYTLNEIKGKKMSKSSTN